MLLSFLLCRSTSTPQSGRYSYQELVEGSYVSVLILS